MCALTKVLVWVDGGCERNGQPDAHCYCSVRIKGRHDKTYRDDLPGMNTCNQAEYGAVLKALEYLLPALDYPGRLDIEIYSDSQLVVSQINGGWKIKDPRLQEIRDNIAWTIMEFAHAGVEITLKQSSHAVSVQKLGH